jgi:hypothetical protein
MRPRRRYTFLVAACVAALVVAGCVTSNSRRYAGQPATPLAFDANSGGAILVFGAGQTGTDLAAIYDRCPSGAGSVGWFHAIAGANDKQPFITSDNFGCAHPRKQLINYTVMQVAPGAWLLDSVAHQRGNNVYTTRYRDGDESFAGFPIKQGDVLYVGDMVFREPGNSPMRLIGVMRDDDAARAAVAAHFGADAAARMRFLDAFPQRVPRLAPGWRPSPGGS